MCSSYNLAGIKKKGLTHCTSSSGMSKMPGKSVLLPLPSLIFLLFFVPFHQGCYTSRIPEQDEIKYNIVGEWEITMIEAEMFVSKRVCTFVGTIKKGDAVPAEGVSGTYKVGGQFGVAVEFFFWTYYPDGQKVFEFYRGNFISDDYMEGTGTYKGENELYGTPIAWGANRITE